MRTQKSSPPAKRIYYVGYYDTLEHADEARGSVPAATDKMDYIMDVLTEVGYEVEIVSASITRGRVRLPGRVSEVRPGITLRLFPTLPWGNKFRRVASVLYSKWQIFNFLVRHIARDETVIVYHSLAYNRVVRMAHRIRRFHFISEMEEIYSDVISASAQARRTEIRSVSSAASFILPTDLLSTVLNRKKVPEVVIHGSYNREPTLPPHPALTQPEVHVVYAGVVNKDKGAFRTVDAARFLPANYHVHILGFGREEEITALKEHIVRVAPKAKCQVSYDGLLRGTEYKQFLQTCVVGVVGQIASATYASTSFPSKILSYMANGLTVVSDRFDAVENSALGESLIYTKGDGAEDLAEAIKCAASEERESRQILEDLHTRFAKELRALLSTHNPNQD